MSFLINNEKISCHRRVKFFQFLYRLFTTVRDSLGLTYDVSFELNLFDRLNLGWYVISVTSTPAKVRLFSSFKILFYFIFIFVVPYSSQVSLLHVKLHTGS